MMHGTYNVKLKFVPYRKQHHISTTKTNWLILIRVVIRICSNSHTNAYINSLFGHNLLTEFFFNVKAGDKYSYR